MLLRAVSLVIMSLATWVVLVFHMATIPAPKLDSSELAQPSQTSFLVPRSKSGVNHLFLFGNAYQRGRAEGELTKSFLAKGEKILYDEFLKFFPNSILRWTFILSAMRWFNGADRFLSRDLILQNHGIAQSLPHDLDRLLDPTSRQVAYHGIHEVGQLFVDVERDDFGCTVFGLKNNDSWIIGRNFDFELQRFFDVEKILKWNFPESGYAYLNIIWVGMVGTTTGVNEKGVYVSINAAGSEDFRRFGLPTTMLVTEVLNKAATAQEAAELLSQATVFVSDIYVVADKTTLLRVEKSPKKTRVIAYDSDAVITNHLIHKDFENDSINEFRRKELTSTFRLQRGEELVRSIKPDLRTDPEKLEEKILEFLRDKNAIDGTPLHLAHRRAIDALIATHSVIYNPSLSRIYVNQGPALVGEFIGFDLQKSFADKKPIPIRRLGADPSLNAEEFYKIKDALKEVSLAEHELRAGHCEKAGAHLRSAEEKFQDHGNYYIAAGRYAMHCLKQPHLAREHWRKAWSMQPAYAKQRRFLEEQRL